MRLEFENVKRKRAPDVLAQLLEGSFIVPLYDVCGGLSIIDKATSQYSRTMCRHDGAV
ncbi:hypothetical protein [Arthrobacter sp. CG_A4]|uniref:hypothetical protein n=1 Tax=Arthrobacter sp. CG_A4 TaxID=3071706 RepID=UPI002E127CDA